LSIRNCSRCHAEFQSDALGSRFCPLCRDPARRLAMSCDCDGTRWVCGAHTNLSFQICDCGGPIVPCVCNPNMRLPYGWHVVEVVRL